MRFLHQQVVCTHTEQSHEPGFPPLHSLTPHDTKNCTVCTELTIFELEVCCESKQDDSRFKPPPEMTNYNFVRSRVN